MSGKPVHVLAAMMHGVKVPQPVVLMLKAVPPVDSQIPQQQSTADLHPPGQCLHRSAQDGWSIRVARIFQH